MENNGSEKNKKIKIKGLDHLSVAVPDLEKAIEFYQNSFGCEVSNTKILENQGVKIAYVDLGNVQLELMEPYGEASPIKKFLDRNTSGGIHHFCLRTEDFEGALQTTKQEGMQVLGDGFASISHHGKKFFFIHPKDTFGSLIEIEEDQNDH